MEASPAPVSLGPPARLNFHDIICQNNSLERKQGFPDVTCPSTMTRRGFAQSSLCREWPEAMLPARGGAGEELGRATLAPSVQPPVRALPHPRGGTESGRAPALTAGQPGGSRCTGMASCCHCSCRRARGSSSNSGTCWRPPSLPPSPGTLAGPLPGPLPSASPSSCTPPNLRPSPGGAGALGRVGWGGDPTRKHPPRRVRSPSGPTPSYPHTPQQWRQFCGWDGAQGETQAWGTSRALGIPSHWASPHAANC